jgi:hypothetical protein
MRSAADIAQLFHDRQSRDADRHAWMGWVSDVYNGRTNLPVPELRADEKAAVPNLLQQGTDQMARRAASVVPNLYCPPLRPGIKRSEELADKRRMVQHGWWAKNGIKRGGTTQRQRSAWLISYAAAPVLIRPDPVSKMPRWDPHPPSRVFAARTPLNVITPPDVIVRHTQSLQWLRDHYPEAAARIHKAANAGPDAGFDVLEYIDDNEVVFVALGHDTSDDPYAEPPPVDSMSVELVRRENRAGVCWAVCPKRPSLDAPIGHFDGIIGMYETQAVLMAMEVLAVRRAIWPEPWLENPNGGSQPRIVQHPDKVNGTPGIITNGRLNTVQMDPSFRSVNTMDRLEYAQRQTAGLPAELGGMSQTNVRTGRRGDQVVGAAIDFTIAEIQDALGDSADPELHRAVAIDKGYFDTRKTIYVSTKGMRGQVDYKPSETFEKGAEHVVEYPIAGTDLSDLVINGGQRIGQGTLSKQAFMEIDPLVSDVDVEINRIRKEAVEQAWIVAFQTEISSPEAEWTSADVADLGMRLTRGEDLFEAVSDINDKRKEAQAEGAQPGSPDAMPGLAPPGAPGEIPAVGETGPSMQNMTSLLSQLGVADQALRMR